MGANPNGLQLAPQHVMLDGVICLLQVHEASIEGALSEASCVNEVAQSEEVMDGGLAPSEACLCRAVQLMLLRPINKPLVENDGIQPIQRLTHSYGPVVGCVQGAALLLDRDDKGGSNARRQRSRPEATIQEAGENPDLLAAAITHGDVLRCMAKQFSRPAGATRNLAVRKLRQSLLNLLKRNVCLQDSTWRGAGRAGVVRRLHARSWRGTQPLME